MGMEIVTGYTGEPHIRPEDDGARNAGIFGTGKYVLNVGRKFAAEIVSNNMVKIKDGDLINQGRHIRIPVGETEECTIENGTQARYRNDLIVSRYSKESGSEGKESAKIVVIKGTASTSSTPPDPSYTSGDILNGALTDDFPLYRVKLNGLSITAVEPLFGDPVKSLSELNTDMTSQNVLWEEYEPWLLNSLQTITLSESIDSQKSGIVLEWSLYQSKSAVDYDFNYIFIPKSVQKDKRITFTLSGYDNGIGKKSIWIKTATTIGGTDNNGIDQTINNIKYANSAFVIRRVFGV